MNNTPQALDPIYSTQEPNTPLLLYVGDFEVEQNGLRSSCSGKLQFEWLPSPDVVFTIENAPVEIGEVLIHLPNSQHSVKAITVNSTHNFSCGESVSIHQGMLNDDKGVEFGCGQPLKRIDFHIVNFQHTVGQPIQGKEHSWLGRIVAKVEGWQLTIDSVENFSELEKAVKNLRGYAITHVARLERIDGEDFAVQDGKEMLSALHWFLSLARGFWSPPILPVGFDAKGECVWKNWESPRCTAWRWASGWLSDRNYVSQSFEEALRGFWKCWRNPIWHDPQSADNPLRLAIHWFISANLNEGANEGALLLAQNGLELMAWVRIVEDEKIFADTVFDLKPYRDASQKIEELLKFMAVSETIPTDLSKLMAAASNMSWANGPKCITGLRNTIVHPKRRAQTAIIDNTARYEARELALWYLELSLLHLFSYKGYYINRVSNEKRAGIGEFVPWAQIPTLSATAS